MIALVSFITLLLVLTRKHFLNHKTIVNNTILLLSIWLLIGITLKLFFSEEPSRKYTDVQMAQTWIEDNPELKGKLRVQNDGTVKIVLKKGKYLILKDGVLTRGK
jgi:methionine-rich copper-binding protein CopC